MFPRSLTQPTLDGSGQCVATIVEAFQTLRKRSLSNQSSEQWTKPESKANNFREMVRI